MTPIPTNASTSPDYHRAKLLQQLNAAIVPLRFDFTTNIGLRRHVNNLLTHSMVAAAERFKNVGRISRLLFGRDG